MLKGLEMEEKTMTTIPMEPKAGPRSAKAPRADRKTRPARPEPKKKWWEFFAVAHA